MPRERWKLTMDAIGEPAVDAYGEPLALLVEPLSLLEELAKDPANGLVEIEPGLYQARRDGRDSAR